MRSQYRQRFRQIDTHSHEEQLQDVLLSLKGKMSILDQLEKLHQQTGDKILEKQLNSGRDQLSKQLDEISKKHGVSVVDLYGKLTGELLKNKIIKNREEQQERLKKGGNDEIVDLVDENAIVMKRGIPLHELEEENHPVHKYYKAYKRAQKGLGYEIESGGEEDEKMKENLQQYLGYGRNKIKMIVPIKHYITGNPQYPLEEHLYHRNELERINETHKRAQEQKHQMEEEIKEHFKSKKQDKLLEALQKVLQKRKAEKRKQEKYEERKRFGQEKQNYINEKNKEYRQKNKEYRQKNKELQEEQKQEQIREIQVPQIHDNAQKIVDLEREEKQRQIKKIKEKESLINQQNEKYEEQKQLPIRVQKTLDEIIKIPDQKILQLDADEMANKRTNEQRFEFLKKIGMLQTIKDPASAHINSQQYQLIFNSLKERQQELKNQKASIQIIKTKKRQSSQEQIHPMR